MKEWILSSLHNLKSNRLNISVRDDLPSNALAGAFDNTVMLSKNLLAMLKDGRMSKISFLFILLHEIAHLLQQSILSQKLSNADVAEFIHSNRKYLEKNANEIASYLICKGVWKKVVALIDFKACKCANLCSYDNLSVQWWMVDGILSEAFVAEDPQKDGKADDIKKEVKTAIADVKKDEKIKEMLDELKEDEKPILFEGAEKFYDQIFDMQSAAIEEGIHETYARDALAEFEKNCNEHIDANSKAQNIKLKLNNADDGRRYCLIEKEGEVVRKINRESFVEGAQWNDRWHYCNARFAVKFKVVSKDCSLKDAFIYSSHLNRMQFLHSMDCSNGSKLFNYKKIKRWAEFCIDVFNNIEVPIIKVPASDDENQTIENETIAEGVETPATENETIAEGVETPATENEAIAEGVETPATENEAIAEGVETPATENEAIADGVETPATENETPANGEDVSAIENEEPSNKKEPLIYKKHIQDMTLDEYVNVADDELFRIMMRDLLDSAYGEKTIRYFFGGDKFDAGSVALGCVTHMIQDSFATSHVKRSLDPFAVRQSLDYYDAAEKQKAKSSDIDVSLDNRTEPSSDGNPLQVEDYEFGIYKKNVKKDKAGWNYKDYYDSLVEQATPIILYANYEKQESDRHAHADIFLTHIDTQKANGFCSRVSQWMVDNPKIDDVMYADFYKQTLNATMARDCSEMFVYMAAMGYLKRDILKFFDSIYLSFDTCGKTTESGLQYCSKNAVENKYEAVIESLLCYNLNEALVNRIITFGRVIILLEGVINKTPKKEKKRRDECLHHICELSNEIFSWTFLLARGCIQYPETGSFCAECAREINLLAKRIDRVLEVVKKDANYLDDENVGETKEYIEDALNNIKCYSELLNEIIGCERRNISTSKKYDQIKKLFGTKIGAKDKCLVVQIITGNKWDAGTDANVYLKIYGKIKEKNGELKTALIGKYPIIDNVYNSFERCSVEIFEFYTDKDVYEITNVTIGHDGKWWGDKWYVKDIIVSMPLNSVEKGWIFNINSEIDKNEEMVFAAHPLEKMRYFSLKVYTGYEVCAGTDSDIYISVFAKKGEDVVELETKKLDDVTNNFEIGYVDFFTFECESSIDDICKIKLSNDGSDDWYVDKVVIADVVSEKTWVFAAKQWVTKDKAVCMGREKGCNFVVDVYTGNQSCGGTDSNIFITLVGKDERKTDEIELNDSKNNFEQGKKDTFTVVSGESIGSITSVKIRKDGCDDWFLDKIIVTDSISGEIWTFVANCEIKKELVLPKQKKEYHYNAKVYVGDPKDEYSIVVNTRYQAVISGSQKVCISFFGENGTKFDYINDDSKIDFEETSNIVISVDPNVDLKRLSKIDLVSNCTTDWLIDRVNFSNDKIVLGVKPNKGSAFSVDVYTGNQYKGGTDSDIYISIYGERDNIVRYKLDDANDNFEAATKDSFLVSSDVDIGEVSCIEIENSGSDKWFLDKIVMTNIMTGNKKEYMANCWIEKDKVRLPKENERYFFVDVYTSKQVCGGTDSDVFISIYGAGDNDDEASQKKTELNNWDNNFESGDKDSFVVTFDGKIAENAELDGEIEEDDVEVELFKKLVKYIDIKKDGHDDWFLEKIVMTDYETKRKGVFVKNGKIAGGMSCRLFPQLSKQSFIIDVYTGEQFDKERTCSFVDSKVKFTIVGEKGQVSAKPNNSEINFQKGDRDTFTLLGNTKIGDISKVEVTLEDSERWFLQKIVITDIVSNKEWLFYANRWINKNETAVLEKDRVCLKLDIYTKNTIDAGTDGDVSVQLYGAYEKEVEKKNEEVKSEVEKEKVFVSVSPDTTISNILRYKEDPETQELIPVNRFQQGSHDSYYIYASSKIDGYEVKQLSKIVIQHNGSKNWNVDKIIATNVATEKVWGVFTQDEPIPGGPKLEVLTNPENNYKVDVYTTYKLNVSSEEAYIKISLLDADGQELIPYIKLNSSEETFNKGCVNSFMISSSIGPEKLKKIKILQNGVNHCLLEKIVVTRINTNPKKQLIFPTCSEIEALKECVWDEAGDDHYVTLSIYTSEYSSAGTNSDVEISVVGVAYERDKDGQIVAEKEVKIKPNGELDNSKDNFEKGKIDSFTFKATNAFDEITEIKIKKGGRDDWHLDKIVATDVVTGKEWIFVANSWIRHGEEITLSHDEYRHFVVDVYTDGKRFSGTDGSVAISIGDEEKNRKTLNNRHNNFEAGDKDSFTIHYEEKIENANLKPEWIPSVKIWYDAVGEWKPAVVIISDLNSTRQWVFAPQKIDNEKEFLLIPCKDYSCFHVDIYTSDATGGGTDANVGIIVNGNSPLQLLNDRKNNFESGNKDSFIIVYDVPVEEPSYITVVHDGSGANADWKLGKIVITDIVNGLQRCFSAGNDCWIKANEKKTLAFQKGHYFIIDLPKSDKKIDAEISLIGERVVDGESCFIPFQEINGRNSFSMASVSGIGTLSKVIIKKVGDQSDSDCIIGEITVTDIYLGKKWTFNCTGWTNGNDQVELEPVIING